MSGLDTIAAAVLFGLGGALLVGALLGPTPRLAPRVRPYNSANRVRLGQPADIDTAGAATGAGSALAGVLGPIANAAFTRIGRLLDHEDDAELRLRLRNSGLYPHLSSDARLRKYRAQRLLSVAGGAVGGLVLGLTGGLAFTAVGVAVGVAVGLILPRAQLDRAITDRRSRMTIDLHAINHHLAIAQKTGGGVDEAIQRTVARGRGPVVAELAEALQWRAVGTPLPDALRLLADRTPEPAAARTYKSLAKAAETGAPIGEALLHLSEDIRHARRDSLQRLATRRHIAMVLVTILLLVPPLLILTLAPVPAQLFGHLQ